MESAAIISMLLCCDGDQHLCEFDRAATLGEVQQLICRRFRRSFPSMKAMLTVEGKKYDEFVQCPFKMCRDRSVVEVRFIPTDDPHFYDVFDRVFRMKITLEEEMAWDDAIADGTTTDEMAVFVRSRRHGTAMPILE